MSEIKSTLDLVMERTKNMVLSTDEKRNQDAETAKQHFNGALQKHLDGLISLEELQKNLRDLQQKYPGVEARTLGDVLMEKINPEALQGPLPDLLHTVFGCRIDGLKQLGQEYFQEIQSKSEQHSIRVRQELEQQYQISGSAVLPNIEADPQWIQEKKTTMAGYGKRLEAEKAAIAL